MLKKLLLTIFAGGTLVFAGSTPVLAADVFGACSQPGMSSTAACQDVSQQGTAGTNPILKAFNAIVQVLVLIVGGLAVIMLVISGFRFVASRGDSNSVKGARDGLIYALIGIAVAVLGQLLISFILGRFVK